MAPAMYTKVRFAGVGRDHSPVLTQASAQRPTFPYLFRSANVPGPGYSGLLDILPYTEPQKEVVMKWTIAIGLILVCAASALAQRLEVKIIDRQDKEDAYDYAAVYNNVAVGKSFKVHGATFTLQRPDGRLAIVNCESKFAEHMAGRVGNRRSCRTPLVESIQADFNGDNAKLIWPVSLDGKKMQSETYKILGILDKPKTN
jgi:hypothetical protein